MWRFVYITVVNLLRHSTNGGLLEIWSIVPLSWLGLTDNETNEILF